jgi:hypothetical protein
MPRKRRSPKSRREVALTADELCRRAKWGGIIHDVPTLTPEQATEWQERQEAAEDWRPQAALRYAWQRVDPIHGLGGEYCVGRQKRPDDLDCDDPWEVRRFLRALDRDRRELARVIAKHPEHASRLQRWVSDMERLGRARAVDQDVHVGGYYEELMQLGVDHGARGDCGTGARDEATSA